MPSVFTVFLLSLMLPFIWLDNISPPAPAIPAAPPVISAAVETATPYVPFATSATPLTIRAVPAAFVTGSGLASIGVPDKISPLPVAICLNPFINPIAPMTSDIPPVATERMD